MDSKLFWEAPDRPPPAQALWEKPNIVGPRARVGNPSGDQRNTWWLLFFRFYGGFLGFVGGFLGFYGGFQGFVGGFLGFVGGFLRFVGGCLGFHGSFLGGVG